MGGRGSGGRRIGSGRKPRGVVIAHPSASATTDAAPASRSTVDPPAAWLAIAPKLAALEADLAFLRQAQGPDEPNPQIAELEARVDELQAQAHALAVWRELAPHAVTAQTLTPSSAGAFEMLCRAVVHERALSASPGQIGGPNHRGLMHRVATWLKDFGLAPLGKPMPAAAAAPKAAPLSKWAGILK